MWYCVILCESVSHSAMSDSFVTPWAVAHQAPLSMGFSGQEFWSGLSFPSPGGSSWPRDRSRVSCVAGRCFIVWATTSHHATYYLVICFLNEQCAWDFFLPAYSSCVNTSLLVPGCFKDIHCFFHFNTCQVVPPPLSVPWTRQTTGRGYFLWKMW